MVEESVGVHFREPRIGYPSARQHHVRIRHLAEGIVHSAVESDGEPAAIHLPSVRPHIQTGAEGGGTVGAGAYAALYLYLRQGRTHIGHVHPEHPLALAVVQRYVVHRHVDPRVVRAADAEIGVTDTQTVIARHHQTRRRREQVRQVLTRVVAVQIFLSDDGGGQSSLLHALRRHLYLFDPEIVHAQRVRWQNLRRILRVLLRTYLRSKCTNSKKNGQMVHVQMMKCLHFL